MKTLTSILIKNSLKKIHKTNLVKENEADKD